MALFKNIWSYSMTNSIKQYFKIFMIISVRLLLHIFWVIPTKNNQICFSSFGGTKFSCNPKYIYNTLIKKMGNKLLYIWIGNNIDGIINDAYTTFVPYRSLRYFYYYLTSKILISNSGFPSWLPFKKNQVLIETWHGGGAYKKVGFTNSEKHNKISSLFYLKRNSEIISFFISSSQRFSEVMSKDCFVDPSQFLPYGMPRNDVFFSNALDKNEIKKKLGIDTSTAIILYAPTFRGKIHDNKFKMIEIKIDYPAVIHAATKKYNQKCVLLYRSHHFMETENIKHDDCKNVTSYPDMQELLYVTDILITDYSSSIWDFSFTFRPAFLFVPDIEGYKAERDFYTPIAEWPFPLATTNEELCNNILNFNNDKNIVKIRQHHAALGSYENGNASEKIAELIAKVINGAKFSSNFYHNSCI